MDYHAHAIAQQALPDQDASSFGQYLYSYPALNSAPSLPAAPAPAIINSSPNPIPAAQRPLASHPAKSNQSNGASQSPIDQASGSVTKSAWTEAEWQRTYNNAPDGIAELRARWEAELSHMQMPPPPPQAYESREAAIDDAKAFAKKNNYVLVVGHSYKDKHNVTNRVLLTCELGGKWRDHHKTNPEARVRNRLSRKTGCPMKVLVQKKRFSEEWVIVIKEVEHNHGPFRTKTAVVPSKLPDLEAALHEWHVSEIAKGDVVHGNTLKSRALALYAEMPQYRGKPPPDLDREWLDQYRLRYNLPGKVQRPRVPTISEGYGGSDGMDDPLPGEHPAFSNLDSLFPPGDTLFYSTKDFVQQYMSRYDASHDFKHITRVFALAKNIMQQEMQMQHFVGLQYNAQAVLLAALLHDVGDHKYAQPGENPENQIAEHLLEHGASPDLAMKVQLIAKNVSFSNEIKNPRMMRAVLEQHPELGIVQDADRLDAIGAVGIGRCFAYGAAKQPDRDLEGTLAHFTEKLERLESMMKTETGRRFARERTRRLQMFRQWWEEENALQV
ncbi:hypothetical protein MBLNU459_g3531t2 [Dothideomycetes sp. NU459]